VVVVLFVLLLVLVLPVQDHGLVGVVITGGDLKLQFDLKVLLLPVMTLLFPFVALVLALLVVVVDIFVLDFPLRALELPVLLLFLLVMELVLPFVAFVLPLDALFLPFVTLLLAHLELDVVHIALFLPFVELVANVMHVVIVSLDLNGHLVDVHSHSRLFLDGKFPFLDHSVLTLVVNTRLVLKESDSLGQFLDSVSVELVHSLHVFNHGRHDHFVRRVEAHRE
jgi:hypothetical protein